MLTILKITLNKYENLELKGDIQQTRLTQKGGKKHKSI